MWQSGSLIGLVRLAYINSMIGSYTKLAFLLEYGEAKFLNEG